MEFDHILIRYGEIGLKGKNRRFFLEKLKNNIQQKVKQFPKVLVKRTQGRLFILLHGQDPEPIIKRCKEVFGIYSLSLAIKVDPTIEHIKEAALYALESNKEAKSFKVETRRADKSFPTGSQEMNQLLGSHLLRNTSRFHVDVHEPDVEVKVEIRSTGTYITSSNIKGLGGLPVGTGGKTLLLLSGGIDSPVAGYLAMKRGVEVQAIHFHSPPYTSERAKQKVLDLAKKLTRFSGRIKIHMVHFTDLQKEIVKMIPDRYTMTVMRRIMLQISERICQRNKILSITTGESLGQVASQTMESMHTINEMTNYPILRPLITMDKEEIVNLAKKIDTYPISIQPYEDSCTVFMPKSPATNPRRDRIHTFEAEADFSPLLEKTIDEIEVITINHEQEKASSEFDELL